MVSALQLSTRVSGLAASELQRIEDLFTRHGLETRTGAAEAEDVLRYLSMDKKVEAAGGVWVLTESLGAATVAHQVSEQLVREAVSYILTLADHR